MTNSGKRFAGASQTLVFDANASDCGRGQSGVHRWFDILHDSYFPLQVKVGGDFRSGSLRRVDIGEVRACELQCDPMLAERRISGGFTGSTDFYVVEIPQVMPIRVTQRGRSNEIPPGGFAIVNGSEGYVFEMAQRNQVRTLRIPCKSLRQRLPGIDDYTGKSCAAEKPASALFLDFAASYTRHAGALPCEVRARMEHNLFDMLVLALLDADTDTSERAVRAAHRQRALRTIEHHFSDPGIGASDIARMVGISGRYLQKIFAEHGETISSALRARRLLEARRLLASRGPHGFSITQIAFSLGFSDPAYFSRAFRQETGVSPRQFAAETSVGRLILPSGQKPFFSP